MDKHLRRKGETLGPDHLESYLELERDSHQVLDGTVEDIEPEAGKAANLGPRSSGLSGKKERKGAEKRCWLEANRWNPRKGS